MLHFRNIIEYMLVIYEYEYCLIFHSLANCLGALTVAEALFEAHKTRPILSELVTDKQCVETVLSYLGK